MVFAGVAGEGHDAGNVTVDGVAEGVVDAVAGDQPGSEENAKHDVAEAFVVEVFEHFGQLCCISIICTDAGESGLQAAKSRRRP